MVAARPVKQLTFHPLGGVAECIRLVGLVRRKRFFVLTGKFEEPAGCRSSHVETEGDGASRWCFLRTFH